MESCEEGLCPYAVEIWIGGQIEDMKQVDMEDTRMNVGNW